MPAAFAVLVGAQLLGEMLRLLLHLPLPGPVIGMFILTIGLLFSYGRWARKREDKPSALENMSTSLIENMGLLFIPAGVGIVTEWTVLRRDWLPILLGLLVSTALGLVVTALIMHRVTQRASR
ncbi:CidA/LrgA family protein [Dyella flagellata]|uniref:Murein hydrolase transporter LrgA n=1 Tax=Dyella flagellata TaxID=1867833 RepID=A0ABQ5X9F6_9GAMM|nr:CidA/LrgA family protein [Dyella flagellata]GLQ87542.1 murein hydrolase transporter LrgA [Dyella flagellata]